MLDAHAKVACVGSAYRSVGAIAINLLGVRTEYFTTCFHGHTLRWSMETDRAWVHNDLKGSTSHHLTHDGAHVVANLRWTMEIIAHTRIVHNDTKRLYVTPPHRGLLSSHYQLHAMIRTPSLSGKSSPLHTTYTTLQACAVLI